MFSPAGVLSGAGHLHLPLLHVQVLSLLQIGFDPAILNRGNGPIVYVVDESGALVQRPVTVTSFGEDTAVVTSGVSEGDKVVTLGVQKLEAGLKVRTVELR